MKRFSSVFVISSLLRAITLLHAEPALIPMPEFSAWAKAPAFVIGRDTVILAAKGTKEEAEMLASELRPATGFALPVKDLQKGETDNSIVLEFQPFELDVQFTNNSYQLLVNERLFPDPDAPAPKGDGHPPRFIRLRATNTAALFHAGQTLRQLLPPQILASTPQAGVIWTVPACHICDHPRFAWRGLMLDCSRTFQSIDYLTKTIDRMAFYKMNVLHLHLTDDQGWRIEIKKHPELTAKGSRFSEKYHEPETHQGFYTRQQMKELVAYAAARHITIVPEIEMPGHNTALLACHPELSCTGRSPADIFPFFKGPNVTEDICCAGNDATFAFFEDVLAEVMEIFPSTYIHIGGDETPKARWKACPKCQARIRAEGLRNEEELQGYLVRRVEKFISSKGRKLIGWDEILPTGISPGAAVMSWRGMKPGIAAATAGHAVVMTPTTYCYFDYNYQKIDAKKAYSFEPCEGMSPEQADLVLGVQANFWSHIDREPPLVDRQLFPRLLAIAERAWSPATTHDWAAFEPRLKQHETSLRNLSVSFNQEP